MPNAAVNEPVPRSLIYLKHSAENMAGRKSMLIIARNLIATLSSFTALAIFTLV